MSVNMQQKDINTIHYRHVWPSVEAKSLVQPNYARKTQSLR